MSGTDDIDAVDARAGEYVLGTLTARERSEVDAARAVDPALDAAIVAWERRLAPLAARIPDVAPPPALAARIEAEIDRLAARNPSRAATAVVGPDVLALRRSLSRWRQATAAASAIAAAMALFAVFRDEVLPPRPQNFVGAFVANDELPKFMLTIDLATRELTIRPIGAERLQGRTYQLWIASDRLGPAPRSLGVLDDGSTPLQRKVLDGYDPGLLQAATFGVSVEPPGGSPTGRPSPGALHARLVPAKP